MASKTVTTTTLIDDIDGSTENVTSLTFAVNGATFEIDLSNDNEGKFLDAIAPYTAAARKTGGAKRTSSTRKSSGDGPDAKTVRQWASENNIEVPPRGRIPNTVLDQYSAAH